MEGAHAGAGGDCEVLLEFGTKFSDAADRMAWDSSTSELWCCQKAAGVTCDGERVTELELGNRGITGSALHLSSPALNGCYLATPRVVCIAPRVLARCNGPALQSEAPRRKLQPLDLRGELASFACLPRLATLRNGRPPPGHSEQADGAGALVRQLLSPPLSPLSFSPPVQEGNAKSDPCPPHLQSAPHRRAPTTPPPIPPPSPPMHPGIFAATSSTAPYPWSRACAILPTCTCVVPCPSSASIVSPAPPRSQHQTSVGDWMTTSSSTARSMPSRI